MTRTWPEDWESRKRGDSCFFGVLWGHGSRQELLGATPDRLLKAPADLKELTEWSAMEPTAQTLSDAGRGSLRNVDR
jgi:hypothetical protein